MFAEAVGGWLANSLALLADAGTYVDGRCRVDFDLGGNLVCFASRDGEKDFRLLSSGNPRGIYQRHRARFNFAVGDLRSL